MLLSVSTCPLDTILSVKDAIRIIKDAGFDAYDMSLCDMMHNKNNIFNTEKYLDEAMAIREYADALGIVCNQAHAPFHSSCGDPEKDENIFNLIVRSMEIASILGAKIIVVHPKQHLTYADNVEELFNLNVEFYTRLIPYCEKFGIKVATENMWQNNPSSGAITDSTCSRSWEFNKYIDSVNSEWITGCLDLGHVSLVTKKIPEFIHDMGKKHISALHVHDTNFKEDNHTLPFNERIDYIEVAKALGEIDYHGDFTYEIYNFFKNKPTELLPAACRYACEVGRYLINEIEKARNR